MYNCNMSIPTEYQECVKLTHYLRSLQDQGEITKFAHLINELSINRKRGQKPNFAYLRKRKAEGWVPGVPDYIITTPSRVVFLEMKRIKGGKVSDSQKEWLQALNDTGEVSAVICRGFEEAKEFIDSIIK